LSIENCQFFLPELAVGSIKYRARRLESVISICLLAILFLIGLGIFIKQSDYDMSRFGIGTAAAPKFEIPFELSSLVPAGFETLSKTEVYHPENLYEKINGKAPLYIESGFEKLAKKSRGGAFSAYAICIQNRQCTVPRTR
jgi:hypothetical protein